MKHVFFGLFFLSLSFVLAAEGSAELSSEVYVDEQSAFFTISGNIAYMEGLIDDSTPEVVLDLIEDHPEVDTIVLQYVPGSLGYGVHIASRYVRYAGLNTHMPSDGVAYSGGVDFFLAGVERTVEPGAELGVHSWGGEDYRGYTALEIPEDHPIHQLYLTYYREIGIPDDFYWFTLEAAPANDVHIMTPSEMEQYNFTTK